MTTPQRPRRPRRQRGRRTALASVAGRHERAHEHHDRRDDERQQLDLGDGARLTRETDEAPHDRERHDARHRRSRTLAPGRLEGRDLRRRSCHREHRQRRPRQQREALDDPEVHHLADHRAAVGEDQGRHGRRAGAQSRASAAGRRHAQRRARVDRDQVDDPRGIGGRNDEEQRGREERAGVHARPAAASRSSARGLSSGRWPPAICRPARTRSGKFWIRLSAAMAGWPQIAGHPEERERDQQHEQRRRCGRRAPGVATT